MTIWQECPFDECDWSTAEPVHEVEADAVAGGRDRFAVHLLVQHGANPEPDPYAWDDGSWAISLMPITDSGRRWSPWDAGEPEA